MPDDAVRPRYYLTTSIAYANNKPGIHTLYEVIGADVIARWHRMKGDETRFLTGTDEHSINIVQTALDQGRSPREFVDEQVGHFHTAEDALAITPDRFIRTTDPDHVEAAQEMVRRAYAAGDIYLGNYEGWYCPNEGFLNATDVLETARGPICPNHPDVPLQWLTERNWFFRLSAYQERLERHFADHPDFVQPDFRRNEMLGFIRGGLQDFSISRERTPGGWGIPFPIAENGETAQREDGSWGVYHDAAADVSTLASFTISGSATPGEYAVTVTTTGGASNFQVPGLNPGQSMSLSFFCRVGAVSALADSASQITESNETNNAAAITVIGCVG